MQTVYVEFFRNIPPLVIIIFFGFAVFTFGPFPIFSESWELKVPGTVNNFLIVNNDRWGIPGFTQVGDLLLFYVVLVVGVIAAIVVWRRRTKNFERTGQPHHRVLWVFAVLLVALVVAYFVSGQAVEMSWPVISENRRRVDGGFIANWGWMSVTIALGLYTASHLGEIIRGSILAVHRGQSEAGKCPRTVIVPEIPIRNPSPGHPDRLAAHDQPIPQLGQEHIFGYCGWLRRDNCSDADVSRERETGLPIFPNRDGGLPHVLVDDFAHAQHR